MTDYIIRSANMANLQTLPLPNEEFEWCGLEL